MARFHAILVIALKGNPTMDGTDQEAPDGVDEAPVDEATAETLAFIVELADRLCTLATEACAERPQTGPVSANVNATVALGLALNGVLAKEDFPLPMMLLAIDTMCLAPSDESTEAEKEDV